MKNEKQKKDRKQEAVLMHLDVEILSTPHETHMCF